MIESRGKRRKSHEKNRGILCLEFSRHPVIIDTTCKTIIRGAMQPSQNIEPQLIKERKVLHPQFDIYLKVYNGPVIINGHLLHVGSQI